MKYIMLFEAYSSYQEKIMDDLLDKISKNGVDSLTPEEKNMLQKLDTIESPEVKKLLNNNGDDDEILGGFDDKTGKAFFSDENVINKKYFDSSKEICFLLKQIIDDKENVIYMGEIHFRGIIYTGYISKNKKTEYFDYAFIEDKNGVEFEPTEYDLHYEFDDLIQDVIYDESTNSNMA
jgi:hypothetical protein